MSSPPAHSAPGQPTPLPAQQLLCLSTELSLITLHWFLTAFASVVHIKLLLRIWDLFFYEGSLVLFQTTLGMLRLKVLMGSPSPVPTEQTCGLGPLPRGQAEGTGLQGRCWLPAPTPPALSPPRRRS